ncbi:methylenetetrahydrofolate reductase (NADPH) [Natronobacillus azotifigens]|uniref:Methylenetetrahydrofolate reductase n=1 Tax=Natronobacillus azotifigens TaxID=472978 RepID=A0A9J6RAK7_9BACI|nr:methylenetetrahydrofolate reductase [NAD(P)H] [Natronobacillus azotifigens]MCZ0702289.1 methylenetetrahydrofolate reductase [NAD(P)H] [Natronobacillus azotifigens]
MKTTEIFKMKRVLSFEIFPPKRTGPVQTIYNTVDELKALKPDFISVTYGAGGNKNNTKTLTIASDIKKNYHIESVAHLPSISLTKEEVLELLESFKVAGIENILALRGDSSPNITPNNDFHYASDLITFIKDNGDFNIIGACYPEGHIQSPTIVEDILHLKKKVDAGADQLITQLFFDNDYFYTFRERSMIAGIKVPIQAGIMPVVNKKQIERMVTLCGASLPRKFLSIMNRYEHNPEAMRDAGVAYAVDQIVDLIAEGVEGIHLYTMNNPYIANKIHKAVHSLFVE